MRNKVQLKFYIGLGWLGLTYRKWQKMKKFWFYEKTFESISICSFTNVSVKKLKESPTEQREVLSFSSNGA